MSYAERLNVARELYHALCAHFPDRHFELSDTQAVISARKDRADASALVRAEAEAASLNPDWPGKD